MTTFGTTPVRPARGLAWPDKARWQTYLRFLLVFLSLFLPVYFGTQLLAAPPRPGFDLYFTWETRIPFVPWMIWPYLSLLTLFAVPLMQMTVGEMRRLSLQSAVPLVVAAICFLALPCRSGFPPVRVDDDFYRPIFDALHEIYTPQNLFPSLHVAFSGLILLGAREVAAGLLRPFYLVWLLLMLCSVVLVHQHHIADVASGLALAALARMVVPLTAAAQGRAGGG